jgi:hypothetical protein
MCPNHPTKKVKFYYKIQILTKLQKKGQISVFEKLEIKILL